MKTYSTVIKKIHIKVTYINLKEIEVHESTQKLVDIVAPY